MSVNLVINFNVKEENLPAFKDLLGDIKVNLPTVPGCQSVQILSHLEDPLAFTLVEAWDSKEIHGAHVEKLVSSGQWESIAAHLAAAPVSAYYSQL